MDSTLAQHSQAQGVCDMEVQSSAVSFLYTLTVRI